MTATGLIWALVIWTAGAWFGVSVISGSIPGLGSEFGSVRSLAYVAAAGVDVFGNWLTGIGAILAAFGLGSVILMVLPGSTFCDWRTSASREGD